MKMLWQPFSKKDNVWLHDGSGDESSIWQEELKAAGRLRGRGRLLFHRRHRGADCAHGRGLAENVRLDLVRFHLPLADHAGSGGEAAVALDHPTDPRHLLQRVDILSEVAQQLPGPLHGANKAVAGRGLELAGVDLTREFEERPGVLPEVVNVEHSLGVRKVGKILGKPGVHAVSGSKVRDTTGDGDTGPGQDDNVGALFNELRAVF